MHALIKCAAIGLAIALAPAAANAADIKVVSSNAVKSTLEVLLPQFEKATEHKVTVKWGTAAGLKVDIEKGEVFDFAILTTGGVDDLIKQGKLTAATRTPLVRSGIGVAVRKGAPKPDLSTTEAFKKTLLAAKSISYNGQGLTGDYLKVLFQRLGIADTIKAKHKDGAGAELVGKGESEIGITQASEIELVAGVELGGVLPKEIQNYTPFAGAVVDHAQQHEAAAALLKLLTSPEAAKVMKAKGLEPGA